MRPAFALALLALAAGCQREPTFDERYAATQKRVEKTSREIDAELAGRSPAPTGSAAPDARAR